MNRGGTSGTTERRLIWNADDFGCTSAINQGVARAHAHGAVRGASMLAAGAAFEGAVELARGLPGLDIGVHLAAVELPALHAGSRAGGLADETGRLPANHFTFLARYATGSIRTETIEAEWDAQIGRVRDAGLRPVYVDSHQHLHALPALFEVTLRLMCRHAIRAVRTPGDVVSGGAGPLRAAMLAGLFALGRRARARARSEGRVTADGTLGIAAAGRLNAARIRAWLPRLRGLPPGTWELVSHPGTGEPPGSAAAGWSYHWADELAAACDAGIVAGLEGAGIRVVSWSEELLRGLRA